MFHLLLNSFLGCRWIKRGGRRVGTGPSACRPPGPGGEAGTDRRRALSHLQAEDLSLQQPPWALPCHLVFAEDGSLFIETIWEETQDNKALGQAGPFAQKKLGREHEKAWQNCDRNSDEASIPRLRSGCCWGSAIPGPWALPDHSDHSYLWFSVIKTMYHFIYPCPHPDRMLEGSFGWVLGYFCPAASPVSLTLSALKILAFALPSWDAFQIFPSIKILRICCYGAQIACLLEALPECPGWKPSLFWTCPAVIIATVPRSHLSPARCHGHLLASISVLLAFSTLEAETSWSVRDHILSLSITGSVPSSIISQWDNCNDHLLAGCPDCLSPCSMNPCSTWPQMF